MTTKRYGIPAVLACLALTAGTVWCGGLNQDEGWYLYAAQLVGEGKALYRDFFYTQGPLMPILYAPFGWTWRAGGLLGARILTCLIGLAGVVFAAALARRLVPDERRDAAGVIAFGLLGLNLYHLYYLSIPKTYPLASLFVIMGYYLLACALCPDRGRDGPRRVLSSRTVLLFAAGLSLAFAAGTRISLGALLAVCGFGLLIAFRRYRRGFLWFGLGGALGLALVYGPFLLDPGSRAGLCAAQAYHAARGGFDPLFTAGSVSRLVRWYLPVFVLLGVGVVGRSLRERRAGTEIAPGGAAATEWPPYQAYGCSFLQILLALGFAVVFTVQMMAPFPYDDYQVPVMGLLAVLAAVAAVNLLPDSRSPIPVLLALGMTFAGTCGSPLLQQWTTNGQDRFWNRKKAACELGQLREMARVIERLDPGGKTLLTQDLYLAIETGRKVPEGLEMGPFAILDDAGWTKLLSSAPCPIAALSGYTFAIDPPRCDERPQADQIRYWELLKRNYELVFAESDFGQNATTLLVLKRKETAPESAK